MDQFIQLPESKLQMLKTFLWSPIEQILIAIQTEIRIEEKGRYFNGIFLMTYGAFYIIKITFLGYYELACEIQLINPNNYYSKDGKLKIHNDSLQITIKYEDSDSLVNKIIYHFLEVTYKFKSPPKIKVRTENQSSLDKPKARPYDLFTIRTIALAHYFNEKHISLSNATYFRKLEDKTKDALIIAQSLQIGPMFLTFGTSIAYEKKYSAILFEAYVDPHFSDLLCTIMSQTKHLSQVIFADYKENNAPELILSPTETSINKFLFLRCCGMMIINFINASINFTTPINEIGLSLCTIRPQEFGDIINYIALSPPAKKIKRLTVHKVVMKPFPFDDISGLFVVCSNLETLVFRGLEIDATILFKTICESKSCKIKTLTIRSMWFKTEISENLQIPKSFLCLNVSQCIFSSDVFLSFILFLTRRWHRRSIALSAESLQFKDDAFSCFSKIDFTKVYPNLCEIDFSGNQVPQNHINYFFDFLNTQKRLHCLALNDIYTDNFPVFLSKLTDFVYSNSLPGIELSGKINESDLSYFILSLSNASFLRHLKIEGRQFCDHCISSLLTLLKFSPKIVEFSADCFKPNSPQMFLELWRFVAQSKTILATNSPQNDFEDLNCDFEISEGLKRKKRFSDMPKRVVYMSQYPCNDLEDLKLEDENFQEKVKSLLNSEIFGKCSDIKSSEQGEDDNIDRIVEKLP